MNGSFHEHRATRVSVDPGRCIAAGQCARVAPEVFDQDPDEGTAFVLQAEPGPQDLGLARLAAGLCPATAIKLAGS
ncbi:ferredoxin [Kitasatospora sp. NPDC059673]|uniref:ferredoxin n=1 Tax=Kitasatospora sp. NPDC059673 TaxID=3346901 RepID=UPI0036BED200